MQKKLFILHLFTPRPVWPNGGGGEMVLVNISSLAGSISLKMHILIVSIESRLKRDFLRSRGYIGALATVLLSYLDILGVYK